MPEQYYRALYSDKHIDRWEQGAFTSFHPHGPPLEWLQAAKDGSRDRTEFPLTTHNGVYRESARDAYVGWCEEHPDQVEAMVWDELEDDLKWRMAELEGVCACDNPAGAFWYGHDESDPSDADRFVVFTGEEVIQLKSEANGGVQAHVIEPVGKMMTREEFVVAFCDGENPAKPAGTPKTPTELPGLSEDGYVSDDDAGGMPDLR